MTKSPPVIELSWRDENYGSVCAVAAFRNYAGTLDWSHRTHQRFRGCLKRAGFAFHWGRCSYIATSGTREERQHALCDELARAGFQIDSGDVRAEA
ncbi:MULTISPECIES: hypothetical protein [Sphingomonas]|jgi:hypothetical protein|uniref:Uncharacterized protein n=1 Tax=Sphingomonas yabuuchiae TaxID=172044 RepID=A0AA40ZYR0_9SPHN|nr:MULTISPECIES: hypothetical protein [Sphingomonas]MBB4611395.1 hypothetical protein [Sphingomonas yabuuchiae]MBN3556830.1 hypothetical protein [Sphingomonas yabuuchiae]QDK35821.1 hypothetical protein DM450_24145 [Sphingomonas sp. IC081]|tara:strand:+ start:192 stop:479 length:288 start_codon:yes stop_codon:yes gene_type:complete